MREVSRFTRVIHDEPPYVMSRLRQKLMQLKREKLKSLKQSKEGCVGTTGA